MPDIHPTAIVGPDVEMHESVRVGPYCVLEGVVKLAAGVRVIGWNMLRGPLTIGENTQVYPHACLGLAPQDRKSDHDADGHGTVIGKDNFIREGVTIHRGVLARATTVGDRNYLMVNSHLGHDVVLGSDCMLANGSLVGGHVTIGDRVVTGGNAAVHQFAQVGRLSMLSGGAVSVQDIPPFVMMRNSRFADCLNLVGLRRAGMREHIGPLKRAFDIIYRQKLPNDAVVRHLREELSDDSACVELADFIEGSKRGIAPLSEEAR